MRKLLLSCITIIFITLLSQNSAQSLEKQKYTGDELRRKLETLQWKNFENSRDQNVQVPGSDAKILVLKGESYLIGEDLKQFNWWAFGHSQEGSIRIFSENADIILHSNNSGYVKLDDWKDANTDEWIQGMREANKKINDNLNYATSIDWITVPQLNKKNNSVSYAYRVAWSDGNVVMEAHNIILGRNGYIEQAMLFNDLSDLKKNAAIAKETASTIQFDPGFAYENYKSGDKVAAAGIAALVAGSLGVKALKGVASKGGLKFLLWLLAVPLLFIGKLFGGGEKTSSSTREAREVVEEKTYDNWRDDPRFKSSASEETKKPKKKK